MPSSALGPLPVRVGLEVERPELVAAADDFGLATLGQDLAGGEPAWPWCSS
ncbi:hypothetical protein ACW4TU_00665 [Streptomyces sp. QTS52]